MASSVRVRSVFCLTSALQVYRGDLPISLEPIGLESSA